MKNVFVVPVYDVQLLAKKRIGRKLTIDELEQVKKGVECGLECWEEVVNYAIDEIQNKKLVFGSNMVKKIWVVKKYHIITDLRCRF